MWPFRKKPKSLRHEPTGIPQLDAWISGVDDVADACVRLGGTREQIKIGRPASSEAARQIELELGRALPRSFRAFVTEATASLEVHWQLPSGANLPTEVREATGGMLEFSLESMLTLEEHRVGWIDSVFSDPSIPDNACWHNSTAFIHSPNGDLIAFDFSTPSDDPPIIYLNHEGKFPGSAHGQRIADNFGDLLSRWAPLGFVGPEVWQWLPFCESQIGRIDPQSPNARIWTNAIRGN